MTTESVSHYVSPQRWIRYDMAAVVDLLVEAKTAAGILRQMPYLPQWIEQVHQEQLRLEAVGTSRIEGAEFTEQEAAAALNQASPHPEATEPAHANFTRSQRQLRAADASYRWLSAQPVERPVTAEFILDIHRRIVTGCDDDRCQPGTPRPDGWNVTFGMPRCRGAEGGEQCLDAFHALCHAVDNQYRQHDAIIQAMAVHYHIGAMHPFGDGNGRTARALEAFMLRSAGVNNRVMVSLSNYYHAHQDEYRAALSECRRRNHDLTPFLRFALPAVAERCRTVADEIINNHKTVLYRQFASSLFGRLRTPRRRVLAERQLQILEVLLERGPTDVFTLLVYIGQHYRGLKFPERAQVRDLISLLGLEAVHLDGDSLRVNLDWPQQASEATWLERIESLTPAVSAGHPAIADLSQLLNRRR